MVNAHQSIDGRGRMRSMSSGRYRQSLPNGDIAMRPILPALAALVLPLYVAHAEMPEAIAAPGQTLVATIHAEGAQVYECKADASGKLAWQFREPIATLLIDGKTVGRHY